MPYSLMFDIESNGLIKMIGRDYPRHKQYGNYPEILSLSWVIFDTKNGNIFKASHNIIKQQEGFLYNEEAGAIHNIRPEELIYGKPFFIVLNELLYDIKMCHNIYAYNITFDLNVLMANLYKFNIDPDFSRMIRKEMYSRKRICIMKLYSKMYKCKWTKLTILYEKLFNEEFNAHNSLADCLATIKCYTELRKEISIEELIDIEK